MSARRDPRFSSSTRWRRCWTASSITFAGAVTVDRGPTVTAYKIGRSFKHFGHNAPIRIAALNELTGRATFNETVFHREAGTDTQLYTTLADNELAFDGEVDNLPAGSGMIVTGAAEFSGVSGPAEFTVVKEVDTVRKDAVRWAGLAAGSTVSTLRENLFTNAALTLQRLDVRRLLAHQVLSPPLTLAKAADWDDGPFGIDTELDYLRHLRSGSGIGWPLAPARGSRRRHADGESRYDGGRVRPRRP